MNRRSQEGFIYTTATLFAVTGIVILLTSAEDWTLLGEPDALFDVSNRAVLIVAGLLHLAICGWLFTTRDLMLRTIGLLWMGANHIVYRSGLAWLKAEVPLPILRGIGMKLGVQAQTLDYCWMFFMAYLVLGSWIVLVLEWRRRRRLETEEFMKHWQELREQRETE